MSEATELQTTDTGATSGSAGPDLGFAHLHVHSEFTLLDGALRIKELVKTCKELDMPAVALTDRCNMYGAVQLYNECRNAGVGAILGSEIHVVDGHPLDAGAPSGHVVLLATNQTGYQNIVRLVSLGWVEGLLDGVPRTSLERVAEYNEGIVALTGCMAGWVPQEILMKGPEAGGRALDRLKELFGDNLYVELQDHGFPENRPLISVLTALAKERDLPLVASNCCHFAAPEQAKAQLALQAIGANRTLRELKATHHGSAEMYIKSGSQMLELFPQQNEAVANAAKIAELCMQDPPNPLHPPKLPRFPVPDGATEDSYLRDLALKGLGERLEEARALGHAPDEEEYNARLQLELDVICSMGFPGYFLIVSDFIMWAKDNGVPVGPGRGSGAGSLVAYSLRITNLDPIPYGLLFERFLNPERVSMPDFDIDFCMSRRDEVIDYVREAYGATSVGQIATFHLLKSKSAVRDAGRVLGMAPQDAGRIAAMIPDPVGGKTTPIGKAIEEEERLRVIYESDRDVRELLDTAQAIEDLTRHAGMHAAGVVISEGPIWDHVPVFCPDEGVYVTQYHKDDVEAAGLVKFDFLGLKTLTVLDVAKRLINLRPDQDGSFDLDAIPLDDPATFALLCSGETTNVFQLESQGMQGLFKMLKPDCFEDIVAAVALYRPGPMGAGMHEDFVKRKHGRQKVEYPDDCLIPILKDTRGVIVYQEQVMQIAQVMGGYSLGGADILRRAMGKKKEKEMVRQKAIFTEGAVGRGHTKEKASEIFDLMAYFAGYGFNKSHSAAYALITYQTAYLKAHFPAEFCCATMTADKDKSDKVVRTVAEARALGITVLPPDVNESEIEFSVVYEPNAELQRPVNRPVSEKGVMRDPTGPSIRFGLGALKGVGQAALEAIFEERVVEGEKQPFVDLFDFCDRVDLRRVNKNVCEALVQSGAFDQLHEDEGVHRAQAFAAIPTAVERGKRAAEERSSGQTSLFGLVEEASPSTSIKRGGTFPSDIHAWDSRDQLAREKSTLGFYVSGHPLDRYEKELRRFCNVNCETIENTQNRFNAVIGGSVEGIRSIRTRSGKTMAFFELEDATGRVEVIVRPKILEEYREPLYAGEPIVAKGTVKHERDRSGGDEIQVKLVLDEVVPLAQAISQKTRAVTLRLRMELLSEDKLHQLRTALSRHRGPIPVSLELHEPGSFTVQLPHTGVSVDASDQMRSSLEQLFGENVCELR